MGKDSYSVVQAVGKLLRRTQFTAGGVLLSDDDQYNLTFAFEMAYCLLVDLLPAGDLGLHRFECFLTGSETLDVLKVAGSLKAYSDLLVEKVTTWPGVGPVLTMQDFKHLARSASLYLGLVTPMTSIILENETHPSIGGFRSVFQWFEFLRHVNVKSLDLEEENVKTYLDFENEMQKWTYEAADLQFMSDIISEWTREFSLADFCPSHGPGSIASQKGKLGVAYKDCMLETDLRLEYFTRRIDPIFPLFPVTPRFSLKRQNEIVFVPKKMDKNRVISKEPCTLAYFQQGVARCIVHTVFHCTSLKGHIDLADQAKSRDFAWEGSVTGEFATLDLSNASDSVTLSLVKAVCHNADLRRALICTRSDVALLPRGKRVVLQKFAPMGSAVCFPMETLIFSAICEMAVREVSGHTSQSSDYVVYGDDIVIKKAFVPSAHKWLERFHFSLNKQKSFSGIGPLKFREACGGYYLNGNDVTPLRLSRRLALMEPSRRDHQVGPRVSLIALCNQCLQRGLLTSRKRVLQQLKEYYPQLHGIPFSRLEDEELPFAIQTYSDSCTNYNLMRKTPSPSQEWWGQDAALICDVQSRLDSKKKPSVPITFEQVEYARWFEYWKQRAYEASTAIDSGIDSYTPSFGVVFAPESLETRPQRTFDVRKWRIAKF